MGLPVTEEFCTRYAFMYYYWYCFTFRDSLSLFI